MLAIVGTVPEKDFPLEVGQAALSNDHVVVGGRRIAINRGTPSLLAAALAAGSVVGQKEAFVFLAGDTGKGEGSRRVHEYLAGNLKNHSFSAIVFHYIKPNIDWHRRVLAAMDGMAERPVRIADAGSMYVAKMDGRSSEYDLFTPDVGELAFLADEAAPHPFYTRGFILHEENRVPDLIARAYAHGNAAKRLLVKGEVDYLADREGIRATVREPSVEALEAIGGTGDTLTGIVSALIAAGTPVEEAAVVAARTNRLAGFLADPDPGTSVREIIRRIPEALERVLEERIG